ncbi:hypothetical protein QFC21_006077 [Naganishia friedmannii]|uniref:Uncharacterized protein n=1 Tax=Naganishia friedmannii TaxID=89922 RepID=A0ACC2V5D1_9TREE|nr:hypothetical protein QFC21_006077 [Naganishia friedmannii]
MKEPTTTAAAASSSTSASVDPQPLPRPKAIIIGAGVGGTATAARLSHAGFDVEVYEKNEESGGRCSLIRYQGWRFDQAVVERMR